MKKTIGIIGGISAASTLQYYKKLTALYYERYQDYYYPEILIHSLDFQYFTDLENEKRTQEYIDYISIKVRGLERAGAKVIIMAANSPHSVFKEIESRSNVPMISIVDSTALKSKEKHYKKLLLTGIKYTMQSSFYHETFKQYGMKVITPTEDHQDEINSMIFDELVIQHFYKNTKDRFNEIINSYNVDAIILGCTELPLLLSNDDSRIPLLDTISIHVEKTLDYALTKFY
ncbi:aspartate/glutamate racemase family protein [Pseudogracilibacillus sp. SO30301A]|uniref:aspartate/glutamate racemase family protein n=1 Tax=Pseudogracilibacillus sp. SO30301A TaxID=3098291 RepID=UPI00300DD192